ncbi:MAG: PqqD family peptide modification chaperone [Francisellaceae bacterium]
MLIKPDNLIQRKDDIPDATVDDERLLMSIENGEYYALNPVASDIWRWLEKPISLSDLLTLIEQDYQVDDHDFCTETLGFLDQLLQKNLIHIVA